MNKPLKKLAACLLVVAGLTTKAYAQWQNVGSPSFSEGLVFYTSLAFSPSGDLNVQEFREFLLENGLSDAIASMLEYMQKADDMSSLVGFPVLIHWAMLYSSETLKGQFPVTESEVGCPDGGTGCNKFTVSSGKERGKSMTFDQFGRLVYIDALKDGFVRYSYDMDLTVNLPPAITFQEAVNQHR